MYDLFQFLHVISAMVWLGSGVGLVALFAVMGGDRASVLGTGQYLEKLGPRLFGAAAVATLLFGILTVVASDGAISFTDPWILIGLGGIVASFIVTGIATPVGKKMGPAVAEHGPDSAEVTALLGKTRMLNFLHIVVLVVVVWAMVAQPGA